MASIITLAAAKVHLRVDHDSDDALIQVQLEAAEQHVIERIDRGVYADQEALDAAIADAPVAMAAETTAYAAAIVAADMLAAGGDRDMAVLAAEHHYRVAKESARRAHCGMVINSAISAAILLIVGDLYENREAQAQRDLYANRTVGYLLQPYRMMSV